MNKPTIDVLSFLCRLCMTSLLALLLSACGPTDGGDDKVCDKDIEHIRVTREHLLSAIKRRGIIFAQNGQTIRFLMPSQVVFNNDSIVFKQDFMTNKSLSFIVKFIETYHVETVHIDVVADRGSFARFDFSLATKRAQLLMNSLADHGLKVPVLFSHGFLSKSKYSGYGLNFREYEIVKFSFFKK